MSKRSASTAATSSGPQAVAHQKTRQKLIAAKAETAMQQLAQARGGDYAIVDATISSSALSSMRTCRSSLHGGNEGIITGGTKFISVRCANGCVLSFHQACFQLDEKEEEEEEEEEEEDGASMQKCPHPSRLCKAAHLEYVSLRQQSQTAGAPSQFLTCIYQHKEDEEEVEEKKEQAAHDRSDVDCDQLDPEAVEEALKAQLAPHAAAPTPEELREMKRANHRFKSHPQRLAQIDGKLVSLGEARLLEQTQAAQARKELRRQQQQQQSSSSPAPCSAAASSTPPLPPPPPASSAAASVPAPSKKASTKVTHVKKPDSSHTKDQGSAAPTPIHLSDFFLTSKKTSGRAGFFKAPPSSNAIAIQADFPALPQVPKVVNSAAATSAATTSNVTAAAAAATTTTTTTTTSAAATSPLDDDSHQHQPGLVIPEGLSEVSIEPTTPMLPSSLFSFLAEDGEEGAVKEAMMMTSTPMQTAQMPRKPVTMPRMNRPAAVAAAAVSSSVSLPILPGLSITPVPMSVSAPPLPVADVPVPRVIVCHVVQPIEDYGVVEKEEAVQTGALLLCRVPCEMTVEMVGRLFCTYGKLNVNMTLTRSRGIVMVLLYHDTDHQTSVQAAKNAMHGLHGRKYQLSHGNSSQPWSIEAGVNLVYASWPLQFITAPAPGLLQELARD
jgi:hypothetical protein